MCPGRSATTAHHALDLLKGTVRPPQGSSLRLGRIRNEAAIDAYFRQSIINLARKHWRKRGSERAYLRREGAGIPEKTSSAPDIALRDELWEALDPLGGPLSGDLVVAGPRPNIDRFMSCMRRHGFTLPEPKRDTSRA